ncbi:VOC family protein [Neorhodopirellula pilleata]|uniref:Glyoxalase-like domain protein n=1 Tax=Neorhodopirellula pilleata TaxID=2714738 RepID=A0A5C6AG91_9BACT|nr:VOC family protein [Neorhodopirellula pilleata]TWT98994.1 Glyoxalase-like domain protein [Neorhodopirellula pilleata]
MSENANIHHEINYIEISANDIPEAKRFYGSAFGWRFNDYGPDYVGIRKQQSDGECGGICRSEQMSVGGPLVILYSLDLEASFSSVQKAGGTITQEIFSFPGGRRFQFRDPSGNELAVWSDQSPAAVRDT